MKKDNGIRDRVVVRNADSIKRALRRRGISYREAAFRLHTSAATVSRLANCDGRVVDDEIAKRLCRLLDRDFPELFSEQTFHVSRDYARPNRVAA